MLIMSEVEIYNAKFWHSGKKIKEVMNIFSNFGEVGGG